MCNARRKDVDKAPEGCGKLATDARKRCGFPVGRWLSSRGKGVRMPRRTVKNLSKEPGVPVDVRWMMRGAGWKTC